MANGQRPIASRELLDHLSSAGFRRIQELGYHLQPNDFYTPLNDVSFLDANRDLWLEPVPAAGIEWAPERQMDVAAEIGRFVCELRDVPERSSRTGEYCWNNSFWNNADALVQYGLVRSRQPSRYVEVGCGWSSLLLAQALGRNVRPCRVDLIEPYGDERLLATLPRAWRRHRSILQRAPMELFERLDAGDVLFYDGSHCAKVASDVTWFFFRILPRLKPGVLIHLHDIFLPEDYPEDWIFERGQTWNEQYLLQAFLMHNTAYRIVIANRYLFRHDASRLEALYEGVQPAYGCSFWLEKLVDAVM
jgi:predicted O-methyltransferase YrrM